MEVTLKQRYVSLAMVAGCRLRMEITPDAVKDGRIEAAYEIRKLFRFMQRCERLPRGHVDDYRPSPPNQINDVRQRSTAFAVP